MDELARALDKLPRSETEQALAFYDEAISDRMEDGLAEHEAVASMGPIEEIAAQISADTPPVPRAIAHARMYRQDRQPVRQAHAPQRRRPQGGPSCVRTANPCSSPPASSVQPDSS